MIDLPNLLGIGPYYQVQDITQITRNIRDYHQWLRTSGYNPQTIYFILHEPTTSFVWTLRPHKYEYPFGFLIHNNNVFEIPKQYENIRRPIQKFLSDKFPQEQLYCAICTDRCQDLTICDECAGTTCAQCFEKMDSCPFCRKNFLMNDHPL